MITVLRSIKGDAPWPTMHIVCGDNMSDQVWKSADTEIRQALRESGTDMMDVEEALRFELS